MKTHWLNSFVQYLDRQAPILGLDAYGGSRKVDDEGWCYTSQEIRCYRAIHYYFQQGLGNQESRIEDVMNVIHHYQKENGRGEYDAYFYPFGFSDETKRGTRRIGNQTRMTQFSRGICEASGKTEPNSPPVIRVLRPAAGEDFVVFFCRDQSLRLSNNVAGRYAAAKKRCAWFFLEGKEPQWEPGARFRLELSEVESPSDEP
jgi:hypothetical protein